MSPFVKTIGAAALVGIGAGVAVLFTPAGGGPLGVIMAAPIGLVAFVVSCYLFSSLFYIVTQRGANDSDTTQEPGRARKLFKILVFVVLLRLIMNLIEVKFG